MKQLKQETHFCVDEKDKKKMLCIHYLFLIDNIATHSQNLSLVLPAGGLQSLLPPKTTITTSRMCNNESHVLHNICHRPTLCNNAHLTTFAENVRQQNVLQERMYFIMDGRDVTLPSRLSKNLKAPPCRVAIGRRMVAFKTLFPVLIIYFS